MLCYNCMRDKEDAEICPYCHTGALNQPQLHQLQPGTVVGGRYTVGRVLGEGGFGITYLGFDLHLGSPISVWTIRWISSSPSRNTSPTAFLTAAAACRHRYLYPAAAPTFIKRARSAF